MIPIRSAACGLFLLACCPSAMGQISEPTLAVSETQVVITFTAPENTPLGSFSLESSPTLQLSNFVEETSAVFANPSGTEYTATVARPENEDRYFYRLLLDDEEIGIVFGSDPVSVGEGSGLGIPINFSAPFTGTLTYTLDFPNLTSESSGPISLTDATSFTIPVALTDDQVARGLRFASVSIQLDGEQSGTGSVQFADNDQIWDGTLITEDGSELHFCLERIRSAVTQPYVRLINDDCSNFLPMGAGGAVLNPLFNEASIDMTLESPVTFDAFGAPSFYRITLNGGPSAELNGNLYQGTTLGSARLEHIVGSHPATSYAIAPDASEPNDSRATASGPITLNPGAALTVGTYNTFGSEDFFELISTADLSAVVTVEFLHSNGDVDLQLQDAGGASLGISQSTSNSETLSVSLTAGVPVYIRVYGFQGASNTYGLKVRDASVSAPFTPNTLSHLSTSQDATFSLIRRPLPPVDEKAPLRTPLTPP